MEVYVNKKFIILLLINTSMFLFSNMKAQNVKNEKKEFDEFKVVEIIQEKQNMQVEEKLIDQQRDLNKLFDIDEPLDKYDIEGRKIDVTLSYHEDRIHIIFKSSKYQPILKAEELGFENVKDIVYIFDNASSTNLSKEEIAQLHQIAVIYLKDTGKDKVIEACEYFNDLPFVKLAFPAYIYGIARPVEPEIHILIRELK